MISHHFIRRPNLVHLSVRARTIFHCCTDLHLSKLDFGSIPDAGFSLQPRPTLYEANYISATGSILPRSPVRSFASHPYSTGEWENSPPIPLAFVRVPLPLLHGCDVDGDIGLQLPLYIETECQGISARKGHLLDGKWATISPRKPRCRSGLIRMRPPLRPAPTTRHSRC